VDDLGGLSARSARLMIMTTPSALDRTIRTDAELTALWRALMGSGGFARRSLWLVMLDGTGRPLPLVVPVDDVPDVLDDTLRGGLAQCVRHLADLDDVHSVAALLSRPGPRLMTEGDRACARALHRHTSLTARWPLHLGTAGRVTVFAPDDLVEADLTVRQAG
jgi:hypothetical protein